MKRLLEDSYYQEVAHLLGGSPPQVYFGFPSNLVAFAQSLTNSYLHIQKAGQGFLFFRKTKTRMDLIHHTTSAETVLQQLEFLKQKYKVKVLASPVYKGYPNVLFNCKDFWVTGDYLKNQEYLLNKNSKHRGNTKRELKQGKINFTISSEAPSLQKALDIFDEWVSAARQRHFMVIKGHYLQYIHRYFQKPNNVHFLWYYYQGRLYGYCGYEIFNNTAQITIMKHLLEPKLHYFVTFFWISALENVFQKHNVQKVFCGSTADQLKLRLNFQFDKAYKIPIK